MGDTFDLVVIGSGPGGYVCAIRAAQLGMKVGVVERRSRHGGTCLNIGCIPSKALLHASERFAETKHGLTRLGIGIPYPPQLNLPAMMGFKNEVVQANTTGIAYLFKKNNITVFHGTGHITGAGQVSVTAADGNKIHLQATSIVIATGSQSAELPGVTIDEKRIVSSTGALSLTAVPEHMLVVGAGVIGLELGSVWRRLGADVSVVEFLPNILPGMDMEVGKQLQRSLQKQGIKFHLSTRVTGIDSSGTALQVGLAKTSGGEQGIEEADVVLIAIGRVPYTDGLGLDELGIERNERGQIVTDTNYQTAVSGIYAIGDVIKGPMLAHKAEEEGMAVAEILAGQAGHTNYEVIPSVVYTWPEAAAVGKTQDELDAEGIAYKVGKFPFTANGRARAANMSEGLVKVLADKTTDRVLGVHIVGPNASEMIGEASVLMEFSGSAEDLARTCHAHPTLSEAIKEAALATEDRAIHI
jgi:dihydrolipoamide dehydrogenase